MDFSVPFTWPVAFKSPARLLENRARSATSSCQRACRSLMDASEPPAVSRTAVPLAVNDAAPPTRRRF